MKSKAEGIERLKILPEMKEVLPFFDRAPRTESTVFVMNERIVDLQPSEKDAINAHHDNTATIRHRDNFLAHQVNMLYIKVPDLFNGGQLEIWPNEKEISE